MAEGSLCHERIVHCTDRHQDREKLPSFDILYTRIRPGNSITVRFLLPLAMHVKSRRAISLANPDAPLIPLEP